MGAVHSVNTHIAPHTRSDERYLEQEQRKQLQLLAQRRAAYTPSRSPIDPKGRVVIVIDDGLATGA